MLILPQHILVYMFNKWFVSTQYFISANTQGLYRNLWTNKAELLFPPISKLPREFKKGYYVRLPYTNQENMLFSHYSWCLWEKKRLISLFTIASLGIYPREMKNIRLHKDLHVNIHGSIVHHSQKVETN